MRYIGWGKELCPTTKKEHYQGWVQFNSKKRMTQVKKIFGTKKINVRACRGTEDENETYCSKDSNYQHLGQFIAQGYRSGIEQMFKETKEGVEEIDIAERQPGLWCMYSRPLQRYKMLCAKRSSRAFRQVEVTLLRGTTGKGKTRMAFELLPDAYKTVGQDLRWWTNYNGEDGIIIDEYNNDVPIGRLLTLLDGYQLEIETKGCSTYAQWTKVIITTNLWELHLQAQEGHRAALYRRITKIIDF